MSDAELLDDFIARLVLLRQNAGRETFRRAISVARTSIGRCVLADAEVRARVERCPMGKIVPFPVSGRNILK